LSAFPPVLDNFGGLSFDLSQELLPHRERRRKRKRKRKRRWQGASSGSSYAGAVSIGSIVSHIEHGNRDSIVSNNNGTGSSNDDESIVDATNYEVLPFDYVLET
jgi:hypothetical protein